jgi:hypothetical protein
MSAREGDAFTTCDDAEAWSMIVHPAKQVLPVVPGTKQSVKAWANLTI